MFEAIPNVSFIASSINILKDTKHPSSPAKDLL